MIQVGRRNGTAIVPLSAVTKKSKWINISSYITHSFTGGTPSVSGSIRFFRDSNGAWYAEGYANVTGFSQSISAYGTITIAGIVFGEVTSVTTTGASGTSLFSTTGIAINGGGSIRIYNTTGSAQTFDIARTNFDNTRLSAEPTWASLGTTAADALENMPDIAAYIPPASATDKGIVNQGVAVADAVGANPTKAEFDALLDSLRDAGIIAT